MQIAQRLLLDLRHPAQDVRALGVLGGPVGLAPQDLHEAAEVADLGVQDLQGVGRRTGGVQVGRVQLQDAAPGLDGRLAIAQQRHLQARRPGQHLGGGAQVAGRGLGRQLLVQRDELLLAADLAGQPLDLAQRRERPRLDRKHTPPGRQRGRGDRPGGSPAGRRCGPAARWRPGPRAPPAGPPARRPAWPSRRCRRTAAPGWWPCAAGAPAAAGWPPAACGPRRPRARAETTSSSRSSAREVCPRRSWASSARRRVSVTASCLGTSAQLALQQRVQLVPALGGGEVLLQRAVGLQILADRPR